MIMNESNERKGMRELTPATQQSNNLRHVRMRIIEYTPAAGGDCIRDKDGKMQPFNIKSGPLFTF